MRNRWLWIAGGLGLQLGGVGVLVAVVLERAKKDNLLGHITGYTVRLVWHEVLRSHPDIVLLVAGCVVFLAGCVVMARPFVTHTGTLFVAIPIAALAGVLILGVAAVVAFFVIALADGVWSNGGVLGSSQPSKTTTRDTTENEAAVPQ